MGRNNGRSLSLNEVISLEHRRTAPERTVTLHQRILLPGMTTIPELLRPSIVATIGLCEEITAFLKKKQEQMQRGEEAIKGAIVLLSEHGRHRQGQGFAVRSRLSALQMPACEVGRQQGDAMSWRQRR
jgi:hypothetical protein